MTVALGSRWRARADDAGAYAEVVIVGTCDGELCARPVSGGGPIIQAAPDLLAEAYELVEAAPAANSRAPRRGRARGVGAGGVKRSSWSVPQRRRARDRAFALAASPVLANPAAYSPLRVARTRAGLTCSDVAAAASLTPKAAYNIESGRSPGSHLSRERLSIAVGVPAAQLWPRERRP